MKVEEGLKRIDDRSGDFDSRFRMLSIIAGGFGIAQVGLLVYLISATNSHSATLGSLEPLPASIAELRGDAATLRKDFVALQVTVAGINAVTAAEVESIADAKAAQTSEKVGQLTSNVEKIEATLVDSTEQLTTLSSSIADFRSKLENSSSAFTDAATSVAGGARAIEAYLRNGHKEILTLSLADFQAKEPVSIGKGLVRLEYKLQPSPHSILRIEQAVITAPPELQQQVVLVDAVQKTDLDTLLVVVLIREEEASRDVSNRLTTSRVFEDARRVGAAVITLDATTLLPVK